MTRTGDRRGTRGAIGRLHEKGFTLVEALVALLLIGFVLLLEIGVSARAHRVRERLADERALVDEVVAVIESVRGGVHPLADGPVENLLIWPTPEGSDFLLDVEPTDVEGVCHLVVSGRKGSHDVRVETRLWRRGSLCR